MKRKKEMAMGWAIALGALAGYLLSIAGSAVLAWLVARGTVAQTSIGYGSMVILVLCAAAAPWLAGRLFGRKKLIVTGLTGLGYYLCLLATTAMLFGGEYQGMGVTAVMVLLGAGLTVLPTLLGKGQKRKHKFAGYR